MHTLLRKTLMTVALDSGTLPLLAQDGEVVTGRVLDQTDALIPGVTVELLAFGADAPMEAFTGGDGSYRFDDVPAGPARVTFRLINFATVRRDIVIEAGETVVADALLVVSARADITITASRTFRNLAISKTLRRIWSGSLLRAVKGRSLRSS